MAFLWTDSGLRDKIHAAELKLQSLESDMKLLRSEWHGVWDKIHAAQERARKRDKKVQDTLQEPDVYEDPTMAAFSDARKKGLI